MSAWMGEADIGAEAAKAHFVPLYRHWERVMLSGTTNGRFGEAVLRRPETR